MADDVPADRRLPPILALGIVALLLVPGLSLLGGGPAVSDETWRRTVAPAFLGVVGVVFAARGALRPSRATVVLALLAALPAAILLAHGAPDRWPTSAIVPFGALAGTILLAGSCRTPDDRARAWALLGLAGAVAGAWTLCDLALGRPAVGPFGRPGVTGPTLAALLAPAVLAGFAPAARRLGLLRWLPALLVAAALLATHSRTSIAAGGIGAFATSLVVFDGRMRRRVRLWGFAALAVLLVLASLAYAGTLPGGETLRVRAGLARAAVALVAERPLTGHGPEGFRGQVLRVRDSEEALLSKGRRPLAAHDDPLHVAAEAGIPGALAFLALLALGIAAAVRTTSAAGPARAIAAVPLGVLVTTAIASLGENPFLALPTVLLSGLALGMAVAEPSSPAPHAPTLPGRGLLALPFLALLFLAGIAYEAQTEEARLVDFLRLPATERALASRLPPEAIGRLETAMPRVYPELLYRHAADLAHRGAYARAREVFARLLTLDPGATEARLDVADTHRVEGRPDLARATLEEARRLDPTRFDPPLRLGHLLLGEEPLPGVSSPPKDPIAILRLYDDARLLAPDRMEGPVALARFYRRSGDLEHAGAELRRATDLGGLRGELLVESFRLAEAQHAPATAQAGILATGLAAAPALAPALAREADRVLDAADAEERRALDVAATAHAPPDLAQAKAWYAAASVRLAGLALGQALAPATLRALGAGSVTAGGVATLAVAWNTPSNVRSAGLVEYRTSASSPTIGTTVVFVDPVSVPQASVAAVAKLMVDKSEVAEPLD